ncbi:MAG: sensor histidine kinase [Anaerolineae bacterium]
MLQYTAYFVLAPIAAIISAGVLLYAWRYRTSRDMPVLAWMMFAILGWLTCNILELVAPIESGTLFWAKAGYVFVNATTLTWLRFALHYTGQNKWLRASRFAWLCVIPAITVILVSTNELHHLIWKTYVFTPVQTVLAIRILRYGLWFWVNVAYGYLLVFLGAALIVHQSFKSFSLYRQQSVWLVVGALMPLIGNVIYVFRLVPGLEHDYTSVMFAMAGIAIVIGMTRHQLLDLQPIARDAVIDSMSDAMFTLDNQSRIVDVNPAALAIMGVEADALLGQPAEQAFASWHSMVEQFKNAVEVQTDIVAEYNQQERHYDLRIFPLRDRRGYITGRIIVVRDITGRKATEIALRERTIELEALNEQLDAFAHTVAHDIKDPLTGVVSLSSLVTEYFEDLKPETVREYMDAITQNTLRLASIVDALLLLASVRQLETINTEPLDMPAIMTNVQKRLAILIAERQAVLLTPETWPTIHSYGPWIEEVWANYVSNAIKYGGTPPLVEIGFSLLDARDSKYNPASSIKFWVRDNGPGLVEEQRARLFSQFTRLRDTEPGHGLGLSIARDIVEKLGGEVGVDSETGQGCTFWFVLPIS